MRMATRRKAISRRQFLTRAGVVAGTIVLGMAGATEAYAAGRKKARRKKATRKKARRKKATRRKARRKKATRR